MATRLTTWIVVVIVALTVIAGLIAGAERQDTGQPAGTGTVTGTAPAGNGPAWTREAGPEGGSEDRAKPQKPDTVPDNQQPVSWSPAGPALPAARDARPYRPRTRLLNAS